MSNSEKDLRLPAVQDSRSDTADTSGPDADISHQPLTTTDGVQTSKLTSDAGNLLTMIDSVLKGLSWLDRFLAPLVLLAMILGVVIGKSTLPIYLT